MAAPVGAIVKIYYDGADILVSQALQVPSGRTYIVLERRVQTRGKHVGRQHLLCQIADMPPEGMLVRRMFWYKRNRRRPAVHGL